MCCQAGRCRFLRWKTPFSPQENAVFTVVNAFGESFDVATKSFDVTTKSFDVATDSCCHPLRAAAPLPFGEGLGVGLLGLCCHLPPCCHHRDMLETQRLLRVGGRVAAISVKKFFFMRWIIIHARQHRWTSGNFLEKIVRPRGSFPLA